MVGIGLLLSFMLLPVVSCCIWKFGEKYAHHALPKMLTTSDLTPKGQKFVLSFDLYQTENKTNTLTPRWKCDM
uniref:Putative secreted protein n=1 Tax=Anopheles marajoara TaxID=58244 RepID=A0A2M4CDP0_9DIPT